MPRSPFGRSSAETRDATRALPQRDKRTVATGMWFFTFRPAPTTDVCLPPHVPLRHQCAARDGSNESTVASTCCSIHCTGLLPILGAVDSFHGTKHLRFNLAFVRAAVALAPAAPAAAIRSTPGCGRIVSDTWQTPLPPLNFLFFYRMFV